MEMVNTIVGQTKGQFPLRCTFYEPLREGSSPEKAQLPVLDAQRIVMEYGEHLANLRSEEFDKYRPLSADTIRYVLDLFDQVGGARPRGHAVISTSINDDRLTTAGAVSSETRIAYFYEREANDVRILTHELTHLCALGNVDNVAVLLDPGTKNPSSIRFLNTGWIRTTSAPVRKTSEGWRWDDENFIHKGHFFEEGAAELIELTFSIGIVPGGQQATVFRGQRLTFEVPADFGHAVAGWALLLLEEHCPGVVRILAATTQGVINYDALRRCIEEHYPGLFTSLFDISYKEELALGAELIMERIAN